MNIQKTYEQKTATIYTDSRKTTDSLKNNNIHTFLIEEIRRKLTEIGKTNLKFNSAGSRLTSGSRETICPTHSQKEAATNADIKECYKKVPKSVVISELSEKSAGKWQSE